MNNYYVYKHMDGDEIVYIGMGQGQRAWRYDNTRRKDHITWMKAQDLFQAVVCVCNQLTKEDAHKLEVQLIKKHQPRFNQQHTDDYIASRGELDQDDMFLIKYFMRPFGATWDFVADAFNVSYDTARNSARRKHWEDM